MPVEYVNSKSEVKPTVGQSLPATGEPAATKVQGVAGPTLGDTSNLDLALKGTLKMFSSGASATEPAQELLGPDPLQSMAHEIEGLASSEAVLAKTQELLQTEGTNDFQLGGVLKLLRENHWYGKHETFKDLCELEFAFTARKAQYLIRIYDFLLEAGVSWSDVEQVGWTKLRILAIKTNPAHATEWLKKAKSLSVADLTEEVKVGSVTGDSNSNKTKTLILKPHPDQADIIESATAKAKEVLNTDYQTVAIEHICLDYLASGDSAVAASKIEAAVYFKAVLNKHEGDTMDAVEELLVAFEAVFPEVNLVCEVTPA